MPSVLALSSVDPARTLFRLADGTRVTYGAAAAAAAGYARALWKLGVREGDRVAVQVDKSWSAVALYLGCVEAGFVFVPLNTGYTAAELEYLLGDARPRVLVCTAAREAELVVLGATLSCVVRTLESLEALDAAREPVLAAGDSSRLAAILYTSGTTGRSKGAMLTAANLEFGAQALSALWRFTADDVLLHALPIYHVHGLFIAVNTVVASRGSMYFLDKFDADAVFAALPECSAMMGVPTHYVRLLADARLGRESTAHVRLFVSGSAPLLPETFAAWTERTGTAILERYGMTETSVIASNPYEGERRAGSVGFALPGTELRVAGGGVGIVEVRGPHVFAGYWQLPEKTQEEMTPDGFFVTADLGQLEEDGSLRLVGRNKDLIITGGLNVYPIEVEAELDAAEGVAESAVVGLPHPDFGEAVTAFLVKAGAGPDRAALAAALDARLAKYKHPKRVVFLPELPRNVMGKVLKAQLRETYKALYDG